MKRGHVFKRSIVKKYFSQKISGYNGSLEFEFNSPSAPTSFGINHFIERHLLGINLPSTSLAYCNLHLEIIHPKTACTEISKL